MLSLSLTYYILVVLEPILRFERMFPDSNRLMVKCFEEDHGVFRLSDCLARIVGLVSRSEACWSEIRDAYEAYHERVGTCSALDALLINAFLSVASHGFGSNIPANIISKWLFQAAKLFSHRIYCKDFWLSCENFLEQHRVGNDDDDDNKENAYDNAESKFNFFDYKTSSAKLNENNISDNQKSKTVEGDPEDEFDHLFSGDVKTQPSLLKPIAKNKIRNFELLKTIPSKNPSNLFEHSAFHQRSRHLVAETASLNVVSFVRDLGTRLDPDDEMKLSSDVVAKFLNPNMTGADLSLLCNFSSMVRLEPLVGVPSGHSRVVDGIVLRLDGDVDSGQKRAVLFAGDFTFTYTHLGFKKNLNSAAIVFKNPSQESLTEHSGKEKWLSRTQNLIEKLRIGLVVCKGNIDFNLKSFFAQRRIGFVENVGSEKYRLLAKHLSSRPITYATTEQMNFSAIGVVSLSKIQTNSLFPHLYAVSSTNNAPPSFVSALVCAPSDAWSELRCDRVSHALRRWELFFEDGGLVCDARALLSAFRQSLDAFDDEMGYSRDLADVMRCQMESLLEGDSLENCHLNKFVVERLLELSAVIADFSLTVSPECVNSSF